MSIISRDFWGRTVIKTEEWHRWFAWRPVIIIGYDRWLPHLRWLCYVDRQFDVAGGGDSYGITRYRLRN